MVYKKRSSVKAKRAKQPISAKKDAFYKPKTPKNKLVTPFWDKKKSFDHNIKSLGLAPSIMGAMPIKESDATKIDPTIVPPPLNSELLDSMETTMTSHEACKYSLQLVEEDVAKRLYKRYGDSKDYKTMSRDTKNNPFLYDKAHIEKIMTSYIDMQSNPDDYVDYEVQKHDCHERKMLKTKKA